MPLQVHNPRQGIPDPFGCGFDIAVRKMSIAQRHPHIGVPEQAGDNGHRYAVHDGMAGPGVVFRGGRPETAPQRTAR